MNEEMGSGGEPGRDDFIRRYAEMRGLNTSEKAEDVEEQESKVFQSHLPPRHGTHLAVEIFGTPRTIELPTHDAGAPT